MTAPGANGYDYTVAKNVLTDTEKDRFLACYLNLNDSNAVSHCPATFTPSLPTLFFILAAFVTS